ncbi:MAG TPA: hypothetical protein VEY12_01615 [Thermoplasmata archaeon]|nr:hypothetical protein [Thermoplasmata archaeon]
MARDRDGLPVVIAAAVPLLAMQVGVGFLRFQVRRKRGVRRFRRDLVRSGMPKDQAARLAQAYHEAGSLRKILRGSRLFPS